MTEDFKIRLLVGLGNPGAQYDGTRHNVGFMALERIAKREGLTWKTRGRGVETSWHFKGEKIILQKPLTFMNLSGEALADAINWYKLDPREIVVVTDDIALPLGTLRLREKGSAGGHNGLKNIIARLGTENFWRLKMGVGERKDRRMDLTGHVLGKFSPMETLKLQDMMDRTLECLEMILTQSPTLAASKYNGPLPGDAPPPVKKEIPKPPEPPKEPPT